MGVTCVTGLGRELATGSIALGGPSMTLHHGGKEGRP